MSVKTTVHWINPSTSNAHTIAVDDNELKEYLDLGYVQGPAPGDSKLPSDATRSLIDKYVPVNLRYIDPVSQDGETIINKSVALFEDILSGHIIDQNFLREVDDLYLYWDVISKNYHEKVRSLIDPQGITDLALSDASGVSKSTDSRTGVFLYHLASIFSTKGTKRSLTWALKLLDVQVDFINWYEPEFLRFRSTAESCRTLIKIYINNDTPVTTEVVDIVNKLVDFLIDICTVIAGWIYTKSFSDDVSYTDDDNSLLRDSIYDCYSHCVLEIYNRKKQQVYGVHAKGALDNFWYIFGSSWNPLLTQKGCLLHGGMTSGGECELSHTGLYKHCGIAPEITCSPEAGLIHVNDTTIRHCGDDYEHKDKIYYGEPLTHNELMLLNYDNIVCIDKEVEFKRSRWGLKPWPTHMGNLEVTSIWTNGSANFTFCNPDPLVIDQTNYLTDNTHYTELHNYTDLVHGSGFHSNPNNFNICSHSFDSVKSNIVDNEELSDNLSGIYAGYSISDTVVLTLVHNGLHFHEPFNSLSSEIIHDRNCDTSTNIITSNLSDFIDVSSGKVTTHNGGSYHDGIDRETLPLIKSGDNFYSRLPNLFNYNDTYELSNGLQYCFDELGYFIVENGHRRYINNLIDGGESDSIFGSSIIGGYPSSTYDESYDGEDVTEGNPSFNKALYELTSRLNLGLTQEVPSRIYHDGVFVHNDGNNHFGYDEINFTGTYDWKLIHSDKCDSLSITTSDSFIQGSDQSLWELNSFDILLKEHHSEVKLLSSRSRISLGNISILNKPWILSTNNWNDSGIWADIVTW